MNTVSQDSVVTLEYHVTTPDGTVIDEGREPLTYLHGGYEDIFEKIEQTVDGKTIGEGATVQLSADEAFGQHNPDFVFVEKLEAFETVPAVGALFESVSPEIMRNGGTPESDDDIGLYHVTAVTETEVTLDANPPHAGKDLVFTFTIVGIRPATEDELAERTALGHREGGCGNCENCGCETQTH